MVKKILLSLIATLLIAVPAYAAPVQVSGNGIYSWWTNNLAQRVGDNTYFTAISNAGNVRFFRNSNTDAYITLGQINADDHNAPGFIADGAKNEALVFYTQHDQDNEIRFHRVNLSAMTTVQQPSLYFPCQTTYAQAIAKGDRVVLFTRACSGKIHYVYSNDWGATWSTPQVFIDNLGFGNPYPIIKKSESVPDRYHVAFGSNPDNDVWKNITYGYMDIETGNITGPLGTVGNAYSYDSMPITKTDFSAINPSLTPNQDVRFCDIADKYGQPYVWYARSGDTTYPRYYGAYMDNTTWTWTRFYTGLSTGGTFGGPSGAMYVGCVALGGANVNKVYVSARDTSDNLWKVKRYFIDPNFTVNTPATLETNSDPVVRPYAVRDHTGIMYLELNSYPSYSTYNSYIWSVGW